MGILYRVGRWHLPAVFTGKYRHGQYSQKWRLPAFTGIYKYFIDFSSNYIVDSPIATHYIVHGHHSTIFAAYA